MKLTIVNKRNAFLQYHLSILFILILFVSSSVDGRKVLSCYQHNYTCHSCAKSSLAVTKFQGEELCRKFFSSPISADPFILTNSSLQKLCHSSYLYWTGFEFVNNAWPRKLNHMLSDPNPFIQIWTTSLASKHVGPERLPKGNEKFCGAVNMTAKLLIPLPCDSHLVHGQICSAIEQHCISNKSKQIKWCGMKGSHRERNKLICIKKDIEPNFTKPCFGKRYTGCNEDTSDACNRKKTHIQPLWVYLLLGLLGLFILALMVATVGLVWSGLRSKRLARRAQQVAWTGEPDQVCEYLEKLWALTAARHFMSDGRRRAPGR